MDLLQHFISLFQAMQDCDFDQREFDCRDLCNGVRRKGQNDTLDQQALLELPVDHLSVGEGFAGTFFSSALRERGLYHLQ